MKCTTFGQRVSAEGINESLFSDKDTLLKKSSLTLFKMSSMISNLGIKGKYGSFMHLLYCSSCCKTGVLLW